MAHEPNPDQPQSTPDEETWTAEAEKLYEQGIISAAGARQKSGLPANEHTPDKPEATPATKSLGENAVDRTAGLELVTEDHLPVPNARREAKLRKRPPATTAKAKADRDKVEGLKHKTPPEWAPRLTVHPE